MAPISYNEHCALRGMVLSGVSDGVERTFISGGNGGWASGTSQSQNISCSRAKTEEDKCMVRKYTASAQPKAEYNDGYRSKRTLTGVGYYAFILPGVALKLVYDKQLDEAMKASQDAPGANQDCSRTPASR
jgi:hypothetical protein